MKRAVLAFWDHWVHYPHTGCSVTATNRHGGTSMTSTATAPRLAGVHHLKLPVTDLERSFAWYQRTLGYERTIEFVEQGTLMGIGMNHPVGGPHLALRLDPARARTAAGFDY